MSTDNKQLFRQHWFITAAVTIMLAASLTLNIAALALPFIEIKPFINSRLIYTLPTSMLLLWQHSLYLIAILVFLFSIVFPFLKLFALFFIWFVCTDSAYRTKLITLVEALAKWSMLDVFIICIMLILTNDQFFIDSTPRVGIYYFLFAILISIICSIIVDILCTSSNKLSIEKIRDIAIGTLNFRLWERLLVSLLIVIGGIFLALALSSSYIQIDSYLLSNYAYSVTNSVVSLSSKSYILAIFIVITLIAAPFVHILTLLMFWLLKYRPRFHYALLIFMKKVSRLAMLDVFCLALLLFLTEGSYLVKTNLKTGLVMLEILAFISFFIPNLINLTLMKRKKSYLHSKSD